MAKAKELAKRFFIGCGKLTSKAIKGTAHLIKVEHERSKERKRIEEERRAYYRGIETEAYVAEKGRQRAIGDYRDLQRARRDEANSWRNLSRNAERELLDVPKLNENVWVQDWQTKKRKKKRSIFDF
jgi:hypothetical protein